MRLPRPPDERRFDYWFGFFLRVIPAFVLALLVWTVPIALFVWFVLFWPHRG